MPFLHIAARFCVGVMVAVCLGGCSERPADAVVAAPDSPKPVLLKVNVIPYVSFAPLFMAVEEGYFADQGLNVELTQVGRGADILPALVQGELDVWAGSISAALMNALATGDVRIVADKGHVGNANSYVAILVRRDLVESGRVKNPADLRGLTIARPNVAAMTEFYTTKVLAMGGLQPADLRTVRMPYSAVQEALANQAVDTAVGNEPWTARVLASGVAVSCWPAETVIPGYQIAVLAYGPNMLKRNPDVGKRFMAAYLKAVRQYNQGKTPRNLDLVQRFTRTDRKELESATWAAIREDGQVHLESIMAFQRWAVERKWQEQAVEEEKLWAPEFIQSAREQMNRGR